MEVYFVFSNFLVRNLHSMKVKFHSFPIIGNQSYKFTLDKDEIKVNIEHSKKYILGSLKIFNLREIKMSISYILYSFYYEIY